MNDELPGEWYTRAAGQVAELLGSSTETGLPADQVERLRGVHGPNELAEAPRPGLWRQVLDQFNNFLVIILVLAALVSGLLGDYVEAVAILLIVVLNAGLGVVQERRAEQALAALRKLSSPEAQLIRDGRRQSVPASQLVPGDLVLLEAGNYVPADLRLVEAVNLRVEEAALTGESASVDKDAKLVLGREVALGDQHNMAFSGTLISYGRGRGLVVETGMNTQIGKIATMLQTVETEATPLQRRLDQLGKVLGGAALVLTAGVFVVGLLRGLDPLEMFLVAVSLAVAAVPEGLPAVVTITLALGMREMIQHNALIRRLSSVETLGSTTVVCSDKTGTLTQNQMTATQLWVDGTTFEIDGAPGGGFRVDGAPVDLDDYPASTTALWVAVLDNDAEFENQQDGSYRVVGDATEVALIVAANKAGARRTELEQAYPRIDEIPFDSERKRMTTVHKVLQPKPEDASPFYDGSLREWEVAATKGAPDVVLDLCTRYQTMQDQAVPLDRAARERILAANDQMARQALRVIALAYRVERDVPDKATPETVELDLSFVGLIGMIDPARPEVPPALQRAREAGVRTIMITGDYPDTARAIAQDIGLIAHDLGGLASEGGVPTPELEGLTSQPEAQRRNGKVLTGRDLRDMDDATLRQEVWRTDVFARVSPEHKMRIVDALKHNQQVVAMTGDGVNDAPALKRSDIGIAMGITGTDVAKETADMVLTDDNYASIIDAIEQGRVIYANIRKFVFYLLSCNVAEILSILAAIVAGLPSPLTAIQLLTLNLITDGAPALALGLEAGEPNIMRQPPRPVQEPIINRSMWTRIGVQTIAIAGVTLSAYAIGLGMYPDYAGTMAFATLSFSELLRAFTSRSEHYLLFRIGLFTNRAMLYAVASSAMLLLAVIYLPALQPVFDTLPLGFEQWRFVLPLLLIPAAVAELSKAIMARSYNPGD